MFISFFQVFFRCQNILRHIVKIIFFSPDFAKSPEGQLGDICDSAEEDESESGHQPVDSKGNFQSFHFWFIVVTVAQDTHLVFFRQ